MYHHVTYKYSSCCRFVAVLSTVAKPVSATVDFVASVYRALMHNEKLTSTVDSAQLKIAVEFFAVHWALTTCTRLDDIGPTGCD